MNLSRRARGIARGLLWPYLVVLTLALHWPVNPDDMPDFGALPFDKVMHLTTFGGLAALLTWSRWWPHRSALFNALMAIGIGLVYGAIKEQTQPLFGRTRSLFDWFADGSGLVLGASLALLGLWVWRRTRGRRPTAGDCGLRGGNSGGETSGGSFVGHAALVSGLTLVSRFTGLVRDAVLVAVFGAQVYLDAFFIGFMIPNLFRRLFGEGALTAAFIPRYSRLLKEDPELARRFASLCVCLIGLLLTVITLVGEGVLALVLERATTEKVSLAVKLTMLMLPYMPLVCGVAFLGAILQVHKKFGPAAAAPILLNVVMIAAAGFVAWVFRHEAPGAGGVIEVRCMCWLGAWCWRARSRCAPWGSRSGALLL